MMQEIKQLVFQLKSYDFLKLNQKAKLYSQLNHKNTYQ